MAVALPLLPVLLATVGPRFDWPRRGGLDAGRWWTAWGRLVVRRRWVAAFFGVLMLRVLVASAGTIVLGQTSADSLARTSEAHAGRIPVHLHVDGRRGLDGAAAEHARTSISAF